MAPSGIVYNNKKTMGAPPLIEAWIDTPNL
jgi:hypothetical protein